MKYLIIEDQDNYRKIQLDRGSANVMNSEMLSEIRTAFAEAKSDDTVKGVLLTGKPGFFSAGLDVFEMYQFDADGMYNFWSTFKGMVLDLLQFPKPLVSAITGHSPAGGCILACCSDYRVMVNDERCRIGLNEIPVGIQLPESIFKLYAFWLGKGTAYQYLMEGRLMSPKEGFDVGLIDELVAPKDVISNAILQLKTYMGFAPTVWSNSKLNLRRELIEAMENGFEESVRATATGMMQPESRLVLEQIVKKLKR